MKDLEGLGFWIFCTVALICYATYEIAKLFVQAG